MEEDNLRRERILNVILIGSIAMLALLDIIVLIYSLREGSRYQGVPFVLFSIFPAFFIFLYVLSRRGFSTLASYLLIAAYAVSNSFAAYRWGVTLQVVILVYALIIVVSTILRGTRFGFFVTGCIAAFIIPVWYVQFHGILPMHPKNLRFADAVIFSIIYFLIMIVAWLYDREIERSLRRAQHSERALKQERDLLEINVEKRTEELRRAQLEKVEQLKRFAELGQLSSGLFHDIFNLLNAISLRGENSDPSLAAAMKTTEQIESFISAVRKQIDPRSDTEEVFSVRESIEHAISLVNYKANKNHIRILVTEEASPNSPEIACSNSPFKFHQILINLLLNAIESYESLPSADKRIRAITVNLRNDPQPGMFLLSIQDNGIGMTKEVKEKIFDPFFTTKDKGKGIGIGLATVKKIAEEDFRGIIDVESQPGIGSLFTLRLSTSHEKLSVFLDRTNSGASSSPTDA